MKSTCSISSILKQILSYRKEVILGNIIAITATLLVVLIPLFIPLLVDELLLGKEHGFIDFIRQYIFTSDVKGYVLFVLAIILLLRVFSTLLSILQTKIFVSISKNITYKMRDSLLQHLKNVSLKEYEMMRVGAVTSKLVTDVETIDGFISSTISKLIVAVLLLFFSAVVLLWIHWQLAIFILITNPVVVLFTVKLARNIGELKKEENKAIELFQSSLTETLELFHQIRAANKEEYFFEMSRIKADELKEHSINYGYKSDAAMKYSYLVFLAGYEIFRAVSILAVAYSDLSVGLMLAIFSYLWVMVNPTHDIINFQYVLSTAKAACKRINSVYEMEQEPNIEQKINPFMGQNAIDIEINNLSFSYNKEYNILNNVNMKIEKGSKVAIVGASGSGKTTLSNILVGFYPLSDGEIVYAGVSNRELKLSTIREHIHLILQHPKLFNDTMLFNLTLGKEYSDAKIEKALKIAQLDDVIERLDLGLNTLVGKDGIKLSGGQRQRVAIARMILSDPKVVIFDESTSALDVHTEVNLFEALQPFLENKTVITIAHRLSTIKSAEFIYVLEDGIVVDSGTPKSLLSKDAKNNNGYFSSMI
ncbi:MAG: ABC-type multidrug transport system, ATPase and permease component [uncultured Sulfurovum sp.]|uniref:ABC-type multidrug transport system, ATPase and permease component n=1 Tax=uncultured Sulfurovum sp. TaxID=269237 RepID=A0A6S6UH07_9BACT|nr:MAG: ABC-type multidrug transport system, ATPase and permease component [uncultured Sulfurovum sp.]